MMKKACVIGHFGFGHELLNGQTIKTKIVTCELEKRMPGQVMKIDTHGGIKSLLKAPFHVLSALRNSCNVIIFPAHNGLRVYAPLLSVFRLFSGTENSIMWLSAAGSPSFWKRERGWLSR